MSEFSTLSNIFGQSAWSIIKDMDGFAVLDVDARERSCDMLLNGQEYGVKRQHHLRWDVTSTGDCWTFGSQWELLAWMRDRL